MKRPTHVLYSFIGLIFFLFFNFTTVTAQLHCWTSVGSAGTVDEADLGVVALSTDRAAVKPATIAASVELRYNIVAIEGLFPGACKTKTLMIRYADNGNKAQVIVRLHTFNIKTGVSSILAEFNSNDKDPSNVAQAKDVTFDTDFNFETNIYYIEVQLIKIGIGGNPLIQGLQICGNPIC
jgi:hypothetical protein